MTERFFLLLFICFTVVHLSTNAQNLLLEEEEIIASFIGDYEVPRNTGTSSITLYFNIDNKLIGDYCVTVNDRADCGKDLISNPTIINETTINVEWESCYWPNLTGILKIRKITQNQISIVMISTSHDEKFDISSISDFLYLNNANGVNATGKMIFTQMKYIKNLCSSLNKTNFYDFFCIIIIVKVQNSTVIYKVNLE